MKNILEIERKFHISNRNIYYGVYDGKERAAAKAVAWRDMLDGARSIYRLAETTHIAPETVVTTFLEGLRETLARKLAALEKAWMGDQYSEYRFTEEQIKAIDWILEGE